MLTLAKVRAWVTADTDEAERKMRQFGQTVDGAKTGVSQFGQAAGGVFDGLGFNIAQFAGPAGVGIAVAGLAKLAIGASDLRERYQNTERQLLAYAGSTASAASATEALIRATDGGVARLDAMRMTSQLLGMGLATSADQVYQLARMAALLGDKTMSVEERMGSFNAMLANQSIERLDTFGISSGRVRARIEELMAANANLSREQAFVNAVLEIGGQKLKDVEQAGVHAASGVDQVTAAWQNLGTATANFVNLEGGEQGFAGFLNHLATNLTWMKSAEKPLWEARQQAIEAWNKATDERVQAQQLLDKTRTSWQYALTRDASVDWAQKQLDAAKATEAQAAAQFDVAQAAYDAATAQKNAATQAQTGAKDTATAINDMTNNLGVAADAWKTWGDKAITNFNRVNMAMWGMTADTARWAGLGQQYQTVQQADIDAAAGRNADTLRWASLGQYYVDKKAADEESAKDAADAWAREMRSVQNDFEQAMRESVSRITDKFQEGMQFSQNLSDLTGGNPLQPGKNGPFEDIYRLQAWINDGSWGDVAAKAGVTSKEQAQALVANFQKGNFTEDVLKLVNMPQLTGILKGEDEAKASQERLAKLIGVDPKALKGTLGLDTAGVGAVLSDADSAALAKQLQGKTGDALSKAVSDSFKFDFKGGLADALVKAVDADLILKRNDLLAKGGVAWGVLEEGMLDKAGKSTAFVAMVDAMVDNALANYVPQDR